MECNPARCSALERAKEAGREEMQAKIDSILRDCYNEDGFSLSLWIKHECYSRLRSIVAKKNLEEGENGL